MVKYSQVVHVRPTQQGSQFMQLKNPERELQKYIGGEIHVHNSAPGMNATDIRGEIISVRVVNDEYIGIMHTCDEHTSGRHRSEDGKWHPSTGTKTEALLHTEVSRDGTDLVFTKATPQGTTARLSPAH